MNRSPVLSLYLAVRGSLSVVLAFVRGLLAYVASTHRGGWPPDALRRTAPVVGRCARLRVLLAKGILGSHDRYDGSRELPWL